VSWYGLCVYETVILMSYEVRVLLDRRWGEYGLDGQSANGVPSGMVQTKQLRRIGRRA
jgi:hypothetical protein